MIIMNDKMAAALKKEARCDSLPSELAEMVGEGFVTQDGSLLLRSLSRINTNVALTDFPDRTGYECFINSIHVDDFVSGDYLAIACLLIETFFHEWRRYGQPGVIRAILSCDDLGAVVKIHLARPGEDVVAENIEGYEDAILVADSSEVTLH